MIHSQLPTPDRREPLGGLVAAIHKARSNNPEAKPLPAGFMEHSRDLPNTVETWAQRDFTVVEPMDATPVFRSRAAR